MFSLFISHGFFSSTPVQTALTVGGGAAIVCGVTGVFALMRGHAFAGHALSDISSAGGAASFLLGMNALAGFILMALAGAAGIELSATRRQRERSLSTGIVLGAGLGCSALFLWLAVKKQNASGATLSVMFGSIWTLPASIIPWILLTAGCALLLLSLIWRPVLLSAIDPDLARIRGINVRLIGVLQLSALALAVALSSMTVGAILSTALLTGPAAIALKFARSPLSAVVLSAITGLSAVWLGVWLAYESFYWPHSQGWPVSFFIVSIIFIAWAMSGVLARIIVPQAGSRRQRFRNRKYV
ncbi:metal ABC transporter permease [Tatumella sp. JGM118]|uniref:metal ABC transporter permease n=1 Tax=Tatumella sp. JGM118 TaxID=2799796 RepID=UPI001BAF4D69|nr:metal ABC transporter permease [Tatumella sp. JGM118]MBS0908516.1 metal ABC transporter permease [Tatumella sp. JGM118]